VRNTVYRRGVTRLSTFSPHRLRMTAKAEVSGHRSVSPRGPVAVLTGLAFLTSVDDPAPGGR
jgi:hypothetical protein